MFLKKHAVIYFSKTARKFKIFLIAMKLFEIFLLFTTEGQVNIDTDEKFKEQFCIK